MVPLVGAQSLWPFCFLSSKHHQSVLEIEVIETLVVGIIVVHFPVFVLLGQATRRAFASL
jgi:hypothetical protein